ncbi:hypothetical protein ACFUC1_05540 [Pedococcus sp. NPDC057267]|uniref:hypothetical protein n=1 Tax=Pedococcus sp. NPDC057267 TaxID=3346077 RepID=UPI00364305E9
MTKLPDRARVAAVQAAPIFLDRDASVERGADLVAEAGSLRVEVIGFREGFLPEHPGWAEMQAFD